MAITDMYLCWYASIADTHVRWTSDGRLNTDTHEADGFSGEQEAPDAKNYMAAPIIKAAKRF